MSATVIEAVEPEAIEMPDGDRLFEIVYGLKREKSVGTRQNLVASRIDRLVGCHDRNEQFGRPVLENLFVIDEDADLQRRPDFAFVSYERWAGLPPDENAWNVVPDWMVEVVSPSNSADEVIDKVDEYFQAGARLVWVVYPNARRVYVYSSPTAVTVREADDELTAAPVLPDLRFPVSQLFRGIAEPVERPAG